MLSLSTYQKATLSNPLSEHGGRNALGIGFRIWVKSKFNHSQQEAINAASREYGSGGFSLVKGPPGTGKTTSLAALVNEINKKEDSHILTIEDPVEFVHVSQRALVNQREVKRDTKSF